MYYVHTRTCILCTLYIIIMAIVFIHSQVLGKNNRLYDLGFLTRAEVLCAVNYGRRIYEPVEAGGGGGLVAPPWSCIKNKQVSSPFISAVD